MKHFAKLYEQNKVAFYLILILLSLVIALPIFVTRLGSKRALSSRLKAAEPTAARKYLLWGKLAFFSKRGYHLYSINPDGQELRELVSFSSDYYHDFYVYPNQNWNRLIVDFPNDEKTQLSLWHLYHNENIVEDIPFNLDSLKAPNGEKYNYIRNIQWLPANDKFIAEVAYPSSSEGEVNTKCMFKDEGNIFTYLLIDLSGNVKRLPNLMDSVNYLILSPDGKQILYKNCGDKGYTISDIDGKNITYLPETENEIEPIRDLIAWAPDSSGIAVITEKNQLYTIDRSHNKRLVSDLAINSELNKLKAQHSYITAPLRWSPDGSQIVVNTSYEEYFGSKNNKYHVMVIDVDTGMAHYLNNDLSINNYIAQGLDDYSKDNQLTSWFSDSKWLVTTRMTDNNPQLKREVWLENIEETIPPIKVNIPDTADGPWTDAVYWIPNLIIY